jgi:hypothetical protein
MSSGLLKYLIEKNLRSHNVETSVPDLIKHGPSTEYNELTKYIGNSYSKEVKIYAMATLLLKITLDEIQFPEVIEYLETCFWLIEALPSYKHIILQHLDCSIGKIIKETQTEEHFLGLSKLIFILKQYDKNLTSALTLGEIRLRTSFGIKYLQEILNTCNGELIINYLSFLKTVQDYGLEMDHIKNSIIEVVMNFVVFRNMENSSDIWIPKDIKEDGEILEMIELIGVDDDNLKEKIRMVREKLGEIGRREEENSDMDKVLEESSSDDIDDVESEV